MATMTSTATAQGTSLNNEKVRTMIEACSAANMPTIQQLMRENSEYACQQDESTGISPLMAASKAGHLELVHMLLDEGAPWNAIDRNGQCAGNYATDAEQWNVVNLMVEWGTRSELILGEIQRSQRQHVAPAAPAAPAVSSGNIPVEHHSSTKPDYLSHRLRYNSDNTALLDADDDAVMMEWERPLMKAHAQILTGEAPGKRVMNVGFGMGIIDTALQEYNPSLHIIIEAHPDVYQRMLDQKWDQKPNVKLCHGKWQDVLPQLIREGVELDGVFFDTYAEHSFDMEDFHVLMSQILSKPQGVYSFFNGLAPDNLFFHGVACQVVKLQLAKLGFDSEFLQCQIEVKDKVWEGVRRKYWHGRDTYYLPRITWNNEFLGRKTKAEQDYSEMEVEQSDSKRQRHADGTV